MVLIGFIDRFENDLVVIEVEETMRLVPREQLPAYAKPGDAVRFEGDRIVLDERSTEDRKIEIRKLMDDVWED